MRKIILIILAMTMCHTCALSVGCLSQGITFTNQAQIDRFQSKYPGCTLIRGSVSICGDDISNLDGLLVLTSISGDLNIGTCSSQQPLLHNLSGLNNLGSIGGSLNIGCGSSILLNSNIGLGTLSGLEGLTSIGADLSFEYNSALNSIAALNHLTFLGGSIFVSGNGNLHTLAGLEGLTTFGRDLVIGGYRYGAAGLYNLTGLNNLTSIGGCIYILNTPITSLTGLESLATIGGDITISLTQLKNLNGLNSLTSIPGSLHIGNDDDYGGGNKLLASLSGLNALTSIGGDFWIYNNNALTSLTALNDLNFVGGNLNINANGALASLTGLNNLAAILGDLRIGFCGMMPHGNAVLKSLSGFEGLKTLGGSLTISYNDNLTDLSGLDHINAATIGNIAIYNNISLTHCEVQSICDYLADPNGTIDISENATGCNSQAEVENACGIVLMNKLQHYYSSLRTKYQKQGDKQSNGLTEPSQGSMPVR